MSSPAGSAPLRVGLANQGDPEDPTAFSGTPASLLRGLRQAGAEPVAVSGALPPALERLVVRAAVAARLRPADRHELRAAVEREHAAAMLGPLVERVRNARLRVELRRAGRLAGVVQHGTEVRLPAGTRYVTYEDATTKLARRTWDWAHHRGNRARDEDRQDRRAAAVYAGARGCCAMSHWAAASLREDFGLPAERVHVVGVGPVRTLRPPATRDWTVPRLLFVGLDWERKNGPRVLSAFAQLRREHPEATLDVVGGHPRLDLPGVRTHGVVSLDDAGGDARLQALFDHATCFVMPSLHEPAGQVYIEAGCAGIPSVGSTHGGASTLIGAGGTVVDPADDAALLAALRHLGAGEAAAAAGRAAARQAALLSWSQVAQRLLRALLGPTADDGLAAFL